MLKVIAIGGGENGRPDTKYETKEIDQEIVHLSGKSHPKVLFIPPPSKFEENYFQIIQKIFLNLGCEISALYLNDPKPDKKRLENTILSADIIYIGGGDTIEMLKYWRKHGFDKIFKKAIQQDIVLSGLSAGAICWFRYGCSDSEKITSPDMSLAKIRGLDYIPALCCPHYDIEPNTKFDLKKIMEDTTEVGLALDNCSAIEIVGDKYRILTSCKKANAYRVYWKEGRYYEEVIEKKKTFSGLKELLSK